MTLSPEIQAKIDNRQTANLEILKMLEEYFMKYPSIRFGQALANLNIVRYDYSTQDHRVIDPFFDESVDTAKQVKETLKNH